MKALPHLSLALTGLLVGAYPVAAEPPRPANVVVLTLDTTRADHLGAYGWRHAKTPHLDALAARGTRFERCDTAAPITLPSHATIFTGLYPPRHGVRDNGAFALAPEHTTVAEHLRGAGWDTAAVVSAIVLERRRGLDQGFRIYDEDLGTGYDAATQVAERSATATTDAALTVLSGLKPPFFLWVHYYDPHEEYLPPSRFADSLGGPHRLYDAEIAAMDDEIGRLLARLPPDTLVLAVGDHGEMLGEHGERTHGLLVHRAARRVPLLLAGPGVPAGRTVPCLTRTADVAPTLLELAGLAVPPGLDGASLVPLLSGNGGGRCDRESYVESFLPFFAYRWYPQRGLANDKLFYLHAPTPSLFAPEGDPEEIRDLAPTQPSAVARWRTKLQELLARLGEELEPNLRAENTVSQEELAQLASLGYLGGGSGGKVEATLIDHRQRVAVADELHRAALGAAGGECPKLAPRLLEIARAEPRNVPALLLAGTCLRETGRLDNALALFRQAAKESPLSPLPAVNAATVLVRLGRPKEAEAEFRRTLALDPALAEAAAGLARLLGERGDAAGAESVLDAAVAAGCRDRDVFLERGLLRARAGRLEPALADFREAARRAPADPVPLENAARAAYQLGRVRDAAQLYERLLRLVENRVDLWKTLGAIQLYELNDPTAALPTFRRALMLESDPVERGQLEALIRELEGTAAR
ncbi:MAG: sulfatase-like hydrolase/transferase [Thermoanaerobaculia bacterium]|nr:sulfatase-like hydrolase/transferase [Thermoanaerobaculia bacterium]